MHGVLYGRACTVHTSPTSDGEQGKESLIDSKVKVHFTFGRAEPGHCRWNSITLMSDFVKVGIFFSSCVYLCLYEVVEAWALVLRGEEAPVEAPCSFPMDTG